MNDDCAIFNSNDLPLILAWEVLRKMMGIVLISRR